MDSDWPYVTILLLVIAGAVGFVVYASLQIKRQQAERTAACAVLYRNIEDPQERAARVYLCATARERQ